MQVFASLSLGTTLLIILSSEAIAIGKQAECSSDASRFCPVLEQQLMSVPFAVFSNLFIMSAF